MCPDDGSRASTFMVYICKGVGEMADHWVMKVSMNRVCVGPLESVLSSSMV